MGESIKELTRKQLQDVCSMLEQSVSQAIQLALNPAEPQNDEEQTAIENQLVKMKNFRNSVICDLMESLAFLTSVPGLPAP